MSQSCLVLGFSCLSDQNIMLDALVAFIDASPEVQQMGISNENNQVT